MKVSVNWIRFINNKYHCSADPMPKGIDALVEKIGAQLGAVEEVIDVGKKYEGIVVAKVISCQKHPNADKLSLCLIDDGGVVKGIKRVPWPQATRTSAVSVHERAAEGTVGDSTESEQRSSEVENVPKHGRVGGSAGKQAMRSSGLVEVVCGAPNVKAGQLIAWIPPGVTVPSTVDKEPFVLETREIRGKVSNGMIASLKELNLGDEHTGILVIDRPAKAGQSFAEVYGLDDYIIDIENKMFTHRPDLFGMLGIAREIAGIHGHMFKSPAWYRQDIKIPKSRARDDHKLVLKNEAPKLVPRFCAVVIKDVEVRPSPVQLQSWLSRVGVRPINNIVDLTNFFMLQTAQPLHAYDYDKLETGKLGVRLSKNGEVLKLIGGKDIKLNAGAVVITDGQNPIGLGGVMGGAATEVDEKTKTIILECANFDMNITRKTAMEYGLFTDAATRFTKGQSPLQNMAVLAKMVENVLKPKYSGGRVVGEVIDDRHFKDQRPTVRVSADFINQRLGLSLSSATIKKILENVELNVQLFDKKPTTPQNPHFQGATLEMRVPFWRTDIEIAEDIVEEVGRLYGYDHLPLELPSRDLTPAELNQPLAFKQQISKILAAAGTNEVLTYSFVHGNLLDQTGQDKKLAYKIANALSPDLQYYRLSLTPSLLEKVHSNIKAGFDYFTIFEIGRAHVRGVPDQEKLPAELERLALVFADKRADKSCGAPFYLAKHYALYLADRLGIGEFISVPLAEADLTADWYQAATAYESARSAAIFSGRIFLGLVGEPSVGLRSNLKLPDYTAQAELDLAALAQAGFGAVYEPLNRYPSLEQDITLKVPAKYSYAQVLDFVSNILDKASQPAGYQGSVGPLDIFQKPGDKNHKNVTLRIVMSHPERTLITEEVNKLLDKIAVEAKIRLNAERI